MVAAIKHVELDMDEDLTADFKAEKISAETVVLNEEGKKVRRAHAHVAGVQPQAARWRRVWFEWGGRRTEGAACIGREGHLPALPTLSSSWARLYKSAVRPPPSQPSLPLLPLLRQSRLLPHTRPPSSQMPLPAKQ